MSVREVQSKPTPMAHFPDGYRWLALHEQDDVYAFCAFRPREEAMEMHLSMVRWSHQTLAKVRKDIEWLKTETRRQGLSAIMGVRVNTEGEFDPKLFRFSELFGFSEHCVVQTTTLRLGDS